MEYLFGALFIISNTEKKDDKIKAIPIIASLPYFTKLGEAMVTAWAESPLILREKSEEQRDSSRRVDYVETIASQRSHISYDQ